MICCLNAYCSEPLNPDDRTACQSCDTPLIPLLRHRFKVIKPFGRGGFSRTYLAQDIDKLNELCIIKQLAYQASNEEESRKIHQLFEQEARQLQQLGEHPQIPALFAYFQSGNSFFLAQQLIDGQTLLQEFEQSGAFNEVKTLYILQNLLPVLQYVHNGHVIHRDIKPENIIRQSSTGKLVLIDFGVSKVIVPTAIAQTGTIIGSHGYVSPEQVKGKPKPCSDLFSLGTTCFHMLAGIDPSQLWAEKGYGWVDEWQQYLRYSLDPQFAYVLNRLLDKDDSRRYQSANEALRDLQGIPGHNVSGYKPARSTSEVAQLSSSKNSSVRSSALHTSATEASRATYSRRAVPAPVAKDKSLSRRSGLVAAGIVLFVGVVGLFIWLLRSPIPQHQTTVAPPSNYPQPNYPPPNYPPPNYPPPNYPQPPQPPPPPQQ